MIRTDAGRRSAEKDRRVGVDATPGQPNRGAGRLSGIPENERVRRQLSLRGLSSVANRTKWTEFFDEVVAAKLVPLEIKLIDSDVSARSTWVICPVRGYVEASAIGPVTFRWIEWVRSERIEEITTLAKRIGLEWRVDDGRAVVFGYR